MTELFKIAISILPVFVFLLALLYLDSYKLVSSKAVAASILAGCLAALLCLVINGRILKFTDLELMTYSFYFAPIIEELVKAAFLIALIRARRIGFMVDAAVHGFAIGAGFALIENVYFLLNLEGSNQLVWVIRGFGTAAMHGTTMAVFGIVSKTLADRYSSSSVLVYLPGFLVAVVTHSVFNHSLYSPILMTIALLVVFPVLLVAVFDRSEKVTVDWLNLGFDADQELLDTLTTGAIQNTRVGNYLESLKGRFPPLVVADIFCLLRIHTELALCAKGVLMMRQAGINVPLDEEIQEKFAEMKFLEKSIGRVGRMAIAPFLHSSDRDIWQLTKIK